MKSPFSQRPLHPVACPMLQILPPRESVPHPHSASAAASPSARGPDFAHPCLPVTEHHCSQLHHSRHPALNAQFHFAERHTTGQRAERVLLLNGRRAGTGAEFSEFRAAANVHGVAVSVSLHDLVPLGPRGQTLKKQGPCVAHQLLRWIWQ